MQAGANWQAANGSLLVALTGSIPVAVAEVPAVSADILLEGTGTQDLQQQLAQALHLPAVQLILLDSRCACLCAWLLQLLLLCSAGSLVYPCCSHTSLNKGACCAGTVATSCWCWSGRSLLQRPQAAEAQ